jgi:hypothetical protein
MNAAGREIWFSRVLWSYMPCTWKGFAFTVVGVLAVIGIGWTLDWFVATSDRSEWSFITVLGPVAGIFWMLWVAERHAPNRT